VASDPRWQRRAVTLFAFAVAGAVAWLWLEREPAAPSPSEAPTEIAETPAAEAPAPSEAEPEAELHPPLVPEGKAALDEPASFASIDLEAAREALPDNLYWETAAPTQDPRLLGDRERAKTHWNDQYGKVLSGTGTEHEIKEFFDRRMQLSSDYVRFVDWVIEHQGDGLSEQDLTLLHVAKRLHLARLEEVPRRLQEAFERKAKQDAARDAWLAEQREFERAFEAEEGEPPPDPDGVQMPDDAP
jgi:hypothetical protein